MNPTSDSAAPIEPHPSARERRVPNATSGLTLLDLAERGWLPDGVIRAGIRRMCAQRLRDETGDGVEAQSAREMQRLSALRNSPIAIETDAANAQHYELPPAFFEKCLGRRLKYSACYWDESTPNLDAAEERMLALYVERAQIQDGQDILELGCGWGSLSLWLAERFPNARIRAVSNSRSQREFIQARCSAAGIRNLDILTCDVNRLELPAGRFDRVVSVEMFEHVRNYRDLLARIGTWLKSDGKLFVHIFCHRTAMYPFETEGDDNWMGRYFFTGGLMPAADTLLHFQDDVSLERRWLLSGVHYARTANAWLVNQDAHHEEVLAELRLAYGAEAAALWLQRWRMFWMACAELFGFRHGEEWGVAHYLFRRHANGGVG